MAARLRASDTNSTATRKRIEEHKFENEEGEEYGASKFGGFPEYFRRKKIKLQNLDKELRLASPACPNIFRGVVAHVNGYTQPSLNDIHKLIVTHGGGFLQYLDGKTLVTHIIASSLTPKKRIEFRRYRLVKPAWVVESVKAGKLLPWDAFRVIDEAPGQKILGFDGGRVTNHVIERQSNYRDQTDQSWYRDRVHDVAENLDGESYDDIPYPSTQVPRSSSHDQASDEASASRSTSATRRPSQEVSETVSFGSAFSLENEPRKVSHPQLAETVLPQSEHEGGLVDDYGGHSSHALIEALDTVEAGSLAKNPSDGVESPSGLVEDAPTLAQRETVSPERVHPPISGHEAISESEDSLEPAQTAKKEIKTAEEHNVELLSDPRMRKSSVLNPDFLKQYYSESRLHHLSTWKAELKSYLQQLTQDTSSSQRLRQKPQPGSRRYILHVDFDCFFAAVSLRDAPHLKDKPVVVAHGSGSGSEIASCNYVARDFGVKNGMWMKNAHALCPDLAVLPYNFPAYEEASKQFYQAILATGGIVQSVSVDEALVDVSKICRDAGGSEGRGVREGSIYREQAKANEIAQSLRDDIKRRTQCDVSIGIGGNILLAKIALRKAKPAGQHHIEPDQVLESIGDLTVQSLPGVAYSIGGKLEEIGVKLVKDVRSLTRERLVTALGPKTGQRIWDYSRGIGRTEVGEQVIRKSVSAEVNWGVRFETQDQAEEFVGSLCGELQRRLIEQRVKGRQLTMKIMRKAADAPLDPPKHLGHGKCDVFNKSVVLGVASNEQEILAKEALSIMRQFGFSAGELRGLGVQMTRLEPVRVLDNGQSVSSQKRLHFDDSHRPRQMQQQQQDEADDPILDDPESPHKPAKPHPAAMTAGTKGEGGVDHKPLNTLGTQFIMPSQVDPKVLAELPTDIRSKLISAVKPATIRDAFGSGASADTTPDRSRSHSPATRLDDGMPTESQLDPETLSALPEDVRREVLASYRRPAASNRAQALLPQSPRKVRKITSVPKRTTPTKKRGGLLSRGAGRSKAVVSSTTLTQSNFVARPTTSATAKQQSEPASPEAISPDFLAALPEDIRREVLAEQRRDRLKRQSNLDVASPSRKRRHAQLRTDAEQVSRLVRLPPRPRKPCFTTRQLSSLPELRDVVSAWVAEFADEPPYEEDVLALAHYLERVVGEERDMAKAVAVVRWMIWVVAQAELHDATEAGWRNATRLVGDAVQKAVAARGLGHVNF
ncbi:MAG: hypothetical protein M1825_001721 [Sarcosagium campestre]|nr:MAG: hypothetical protein M1825_001721 [Sarcosagium campestre]